MSADAHLRETVLVVDDDQRLARLVTEMLRYSGYEVITVTAPEKALDMVQNGCRHIDVLVSDIFMPGMSGPELAERLRVQMPKLPVVLMSGNVDGRPADFPFLEKPFGLVQLQQTMIRALHGWAAGDHRSGH